MRFALFVFIFTAVAMLYGCNVRMTEAQRSPQFTITHQKTAKQAYDTSEVWIAENYVSAKSVIEVRQPENGLIIGNGVSAITVQESAFMTPALFDEYKYRIKISNRDTSTVLSFVIEDREFGEKTASQIIPKLRQDANKLAESLGGSVTSEKTEIPSVEPAHDWRDDRKQQ